MMFSNTIVVGLKEVWAHKFRSLLTMLGIILGVASLVGMAAIIKGMENGTKETMVAMGGADRVNVDQQDVPAEQEHLADQAPGNTMADVEALRGCAPLMRLVSPKMDVDDLIATRADKSVRRLQKMIAMIGAAGVSQFVHDFLYAGRTSMPRPCAVMVPSMKMVSPRRNVLRTWPRNDDPTYGLSACR